jgi:hypothetical protein
MDTPALTFAEIDRRLAAMPEGPTAILNMPKWLLLFNVVGMAGLVSGLLPGVLAYVVAPAAWMADAARIGLVVAIVGFALPFLRSVVMFAVNVAHWKKEQAAQLDHDLHAHRNLIGWIATHPVEHVAELREYSRRVRDALAERLALLGGVEKLGLFPILMSVALHARAVMETIDTHSWEAPVGLMLVLLYAITFVGNLMRHRLALYDWLLLRAVEAKARAAA